MTAPLDPEIAAFVEACAAFEAESDAPDAARTAYRRACAHFATPRPAGMTVRDERLGGIRVRRYRPRAGAAGRLLFLHGGGWVVGDLDSHDPVVADLAEQAGVEALAVDYRLAPEHPWPAAVEDGWAALAAYAAEPGPPPVVAGDSAGGNLAAVLAALARDRGVALAGQVLIYPAIYADMSLPSRREQAQAPMLSAADMLHYGRLYLGREPTAADLADPRLVPARADLRGVAPAFLTAAELDPLRDDAPHYAAALRDAGVPATAIVEPGLVHAWLRARAVSSRAAAAFARVVAAIRGFVT
jgi:acetyl esterase